MESQYPPQKIASIAGIHDSKVVGLRLDAEDTVAVSLATPNRHHDLVFEGVVIFHADSFQMQNIVFELCDTYGPSVDIEKVIDCLQCQGSIDRESLFVTEVIERVKKGELHLYELVASLGCWFVCIAASVCNRITSWHSPRNEVEEPGEGSVGRG
jgi:hypothetical protein